MKIVVFGATGGIGAYTLLHLLEQRKYELAAVGHRKSDNGFFESKGIPYYSVYIADYKILIAFRKKMYLQLKTW